MWPFSLWISLERHKTNNNNKKQMSRRDPEGWIDGWQVYDAEKEYARQGISSVHIQSKWRVSTLNKEYVFSPTYPQLLCVPATVSDELLLEIGKYRSKARIPVLSWINPANKSVIVRCSQPMVGLNSRCSQDEELIS